VGSNPVLPTKLALLTEQQQAETILGESLKALALLAYYNSAMSKKSHQQTALPSAFPQHPPATMFQFQNQQQIVAPVDSFLRKNMAAKDQYLSIKAHFQTLPNRQGWQPQLG
jgi:hypothetical protein